jgi:hypothetical protein
MQKAESLSFPTVSGSGGQGSGTESSLTKYALAFSPLICQWILHFNSYTFVPDFA